MCVLLDPDGCVRKRPMVRGTVHDREMQGLSKAATAHSDATASDTYTYVSYAHTYTDPSHTDAYAYATHTDPYGYTNANTTCAY